MENTNHIDDEPSTLVASSENPSWPCEVCALNNDKKMAAKLKAKDTKVRNNQPENQVNKLLKQLQTFKKRSQKIIIDASAFLREEGQEQKQQIQTLLSDISASWAELGFASV